MIASITKTYVSAAILRLVELDKIELDQSIQDLLPAERVKGLQKAGYMIADITVAHLCSHTSGIKDYVGTDHYQGSTLGQADKEWARDEQIGLALSFPPSSRAGAQFEYSETNYLLLSEILEQQTGLAFYEAIRQLHKYQQYELNETWFVMLEKAPNHLRSLTHQFASEYQVESSSLHPTLVLDCNKFNFPHHLKYPTEPSVGYFAFRPRQMT